MVKQNKENSKTTKKVTPKTKDKPVKVKVVKVKVVKEKIAKVKTPKVKVVKPKKEKVLRTKKIVRPSSKETTKFSHFLIPLHEKASEKEIKDLFEYHNISMKELPKILINDPAIRHLNAKENDVIRITRKSETAGKSVFYRGVINE